MRDLGRLRNGTATDDKDLSKEYQQLLQRGPAA
jgi:hypothetical protein